MTTVRRALLVLAAMTLAACGRHAIFPETEEHIVGSGDTVYSIAWAQGVDFRELASWNNLKPPYRIYPGQRLVLHPFGDYSDDEPRARSDPKPAPRAGAQVATRPMGDSKPLETRPLEQSQPSASASLPPPPPAPPAPAPAVEQAAEPAERPAMAPPPVPRAVSFAGPWGWPAEGEPSKPQSPARKGVDIHGKLGQPVHAARGGRVVYAGSGLKGYGLLAIVKHDESYLSAYGHNDSLLVREGDEVTAGQPIARMGLGPENLPLLYFEVRRNGKPIDPYKVLPKP